MIEILLAIIAAELGFAVMLGVAIFAMEFYSLYTRFQAMKEEASVTKIRLTPDEMEQLLSGKGLPGMPANLQKKLADDATPSAASGQYL